MPVLILNAGTASPVTIQVQSAGENAPTEIGSVTPSFNGPDRSSVRAVKRNYGSLSTYVSTVVKDSIIDLLKSGRQIPCSGDLLSNIQKQCTVRYTGATMSNQIVDMWTVGLTLSEVQPNNILLRYSPGDTITGESFTRSTAARYFDINGIWQSAAINVKRDGHYENGVKSFLREDARTNSCLQCRDFTQAVWVKTGTGTVGSTVYSVDGTLTAGTIADTDAGVKTDWTQTITVPVDSHTHCISFYIQKDADTTRFPLLVGGILGGTAVIHQVSLNTQTGAVVLNSAVGTGTHRVVDGGTWWIVEITLTNNGSASNTSLVVGVEPAYGTTINVSNVAATGSLKVGHVQVELNASFFSSPIITTTVPVLRAADFYSLPYTAPPGETSAYGKFYERANPNTNGRVFAITSAADAFPEWILYSKAGLYSTFHDNTPSSVEGTLAVANAYRDFTELLSHLYGDGSVDTTQSLNSLAPTSSVQSAALALATAWSAQLCWIGSSGTVAGTGGFFALTGFVIVAGARSISEMRAA
jgi:hypothetical protein